MCCLPCVHVRLRARLESDVCRTGAADGPVTPCLFAPIPREGSTAGLTQPAPLRAGPLFDQRHLEKQRREDPAFRPVQSVKHVERVNLECTAREMGLLSGGGPRRALQGMQQAVLVAVLVALFVSLAVAGGLRAYASPSRARCHPSPGRGSRRSPITGSDPARCAPAAAPRTPPEVPHTDAGPAMQAGTGRAGGGAGPGRILGESSPRRRRVVGARHGGS